MGEKKDRLKYNVIVIGAGHAGCEAALASARNNAKTLLISINMDTIELMPFGNEMGGFGKDLLIRETDVLGGEIYKNINKNYINLKIERNQADPLIKTMKILVDRRRYSLSMKKVLENQDNLDLRQGLVIDICRKGKMYDLKTSDGIVYSCDCAVICAGTFLNAKIFWGKYEIEAGRQGEICSKNLSENLKKSGFKFERIRNYIAPMVDKKTIKTEGLEEQIFEKTPNLCGKDLKSKKQLYSYKTYISGDFIKYIFKNEEKIISDCNYNSKGKADFLPIEARMLRNKITGREEIFIQPLGRDTNESYLQGLETALQEELQVEMIKKIDDLKEAEITRPGYGIEFNYLYPPQLDSDLQSKNMKGIYFAGRVNGTGGYEESAAQGIVAGINASRKARGFESIFFKKEDSCTGMLINNIAFGKKNRQLSRANPDFKEYIYYRRQNIDSGRIIEFLKG